MTQYEIKQTTIRLRDRGQITIPRAVREKWAAETDDPDTLNLVQIGDAVILSPKKLLLPNLSQKFSKLMDEEGVSLADLLEGLSAEREAIYQETYGNDA